MKIKIYQVDAFTDRLFSGNPAAVCPLDKWLDIDIMQSIAAENNLSETAFFVENKKGYDLRWFTPTIEVELCGHATLASAHVLFNHLNYSNEKIHFYTKSGELTVKKDRNRLSMNFPARIPKPVDHYQKITNGLGKAPKYLLKDLNYLAVFENEQDVLNLNPDFAVLNQIRDSGIICTARGSDYDFVSRYFAPYAGIDEDPVTGSAHTTLTKYWSEKLNKKELTGRQVSNRGGTVFCKDLGERVEIAGNAVTFLTGEINFE